MLIRIWKLFVFLLAALASGAGMVAVNWMAGFSYAGNTPTAIILHIVGTMWCGAGVGAVYRWAIASRRAQRTWTVEG